MSRVSSLAINAADHLVTKGRLDAAASILRNYLSKNASKPEVLQRLGRILLMQGRSAEAVPLLQQALSEFKVVAEADSAKPNVLDANDKQVPDSGGPVPNAVDPLELNSSTEAVVAES